MAENENNLPAEQDAPAAATDAATSEMSDTMQEPNAEQAAGEAEDESDEEITYHAVEKDGHVTAIWEMQGRKHLRTIDPRSRQGQEILRLYTSEHHEEADAAAAQ